MKQSRREEMTEKAKKIPASVDAWDSGELGNSESNARPAAHEMEHAIDEALGLQAISIRLPKSTIDTYKLLAKMHGVGYQPLMRDAICRWAEGELKMMAVAAAETKRQETAQKAAKHTREDKHPQMRKAA
jgi:predicted DNA binding CopG/RHH family protein